MTDAQLWEFFGRRCDPSPEPNDEWNARAKAAILSDDLPANASSEMTAVDAARYICRLLRVLQEDAGTDAMLSRDPTAGTVCDNQVRAAFVRGIALRGGDPMEASLLFTRGMEEAELRELVGSDLISPGREDCLFLTGTGRVVAEVVVASDRGQGVQGTITKLQQAALDGEFSEWVRNAVERFAKDYDLLDAAIHKEVIRQYESLYEDFVAKHFPTDDGPIWVGGSQAETKLAMREDFENTEKFRAADAWSKNGSRCLSCGRDFANRPIDLATLTEDACRTLVALYLMSLGDSVLLVSKPPDWNEWRGSDDKAESGIAWMVNDIDGPPDDRFERIGLVIEKVFAEWKVAAADLQADSENCDCDLDADSRSVEERTSGASAAGTRSREKMSGNRVYDSYQQEVDNLKAAAVYTLAVCDNLKRMLEGIRDNEPHWAARAIIELLDPNYQCRSYVDKVDHLIAPVSVPVNVPRRTKMHRGPDGIHYEKKFPLTIELREEPLAHRAAWVIHDTVVTYLWSVWRRGNPTLVCCDAIEATDKLVGPRWQEIRDELEAFADYDCDGLLQAVKSESNAAMERCRQSIVGNGTTVSTETHKVFIPTPLQAAILKALDGKAMKKQALANEACAGEGTRLYRKGGIKELRALGRVDHKDGVGYFRPDAPPVN